MLRSEGGCTAAAPLMEAHWYRAWSHRLLRSDADVKACHPVVGVWCIAGMPHQPPPLQYRVLSKESTAVGQYLWFPLRSQGGSQQVEWVGGHCGCCSCNASTRKGHYWGQWVVTYSSIPMGQLLFDCCVARRQDATDLAALIVQLSACIVTEPQTALLCMGWSIVDQVQFPSTGPVGATCLRLKNSVACVDMCEHYRNALFLEYSKESLSYSSVL
jgi:hypothetical protein